MSASFSPSESMYLNKQQKHEAIISQKYKQILITEEYQMDIL